MTTAITVSQAQGFIQRNPSFRGSVNVESFIDSNKPANFSVMVRDNRLVLCSEDDKYEGSLDLTPKTQSSWNFHFTRREPYEMIDDPSKHTKLMISDVGFDLIPRNTSSSRLNERASELEMVNPTQVSVNMNVIVQGCSLYNATIAALRKAIQTEESKL